MFPIAFSYLKAPKVSSVELYESKSIILFLVYKPYGNTSYTTSSDVRKTSMYENG